MWFEFGQTWASPCRHVTAGATPAANLCLLLNAFSLHVLRSCARCSVTQFSARIPRTRHETRPSPLCDHSPDQNPLLAPAVPKQYTCKAVFPWLVPPGAKLHVPLALPGSRFSRDPVTLLASPLGGTRWFLTGYLDVWKHGGRAQLRRPREELLFGYFSSGFLQKQAKWNLSWRKSC